MKRLLVAAMLIAAAPLAAGAADLDTIFRLNQTQFRLLSEDLGAALSYKALIPSEPLGVPGFDVGLAVTGTDLKNPQLLSLASNGDSVSSVLPVPTLRLHVGLPFGLDVGAQYAEALDSRIKLYGGELRWALVSGNVLLPAVAVRAAYTQLDGIEQLDLKTASADISVSKGFAMFTPYAGVGQVWTRSTPKGIATLQKEDFTQTKYYAGLNVFLGVNFAFEVDSTDGIVTYGAKMGFRF